MGPVGPKGFSALPRLTARLATLSMPVPLGSPASAATFVPIAMAPLRNPPEEFATVPSPNPSAKLPKVLAQPGPEVEWKQAKVLADLADLVAGKDTAMAERYRA